MRSAFPVRTKVAATKVGRGRFGGALLIANTLGLILLVFSALGLSAYRDGLLAARTEMVERQAVLTRAALSPDALAACGDVSCLIKRAEAQRVLQATSAGFEGRLILFRAEGQAPVFVAEDPQPDVFEPAAVPVPGTLPKGALPSTVRETVSGWLEWLVFELPIRHRIIDGDVQAEAAGVLRGEGGPEHKLRYTDDGAIVASVSLPILEDGKIAGVVVAESRSIDVVSRRIRTILLPVTVLTFGLASFCALILTAAVTQPLRQLSAAAEQVRSSVGRAGQVKLPDLDHRRDDVGRLSRSFRTMVHALVERIESIDSFAADVSHELKNPLTSIRSAIETFDKCKNDEQRQRLLEVISVDVERMDRLISDISSASRLDAQLATETRHTLLASKLVGDVAGSYKAVTEAGGPVVNFWDDTSGSNVLFGAPAALGRVLRNLIDNAVSFSPMSGAVTVALEATSSSRPDEILVTVTDEGPGVPPENLESIFDRFYTSRPQGSTFGSNSGLGLAIARQIIESHGGRIWAENVEPEKPDVLGADFAGARFSIVLPIHKGGLS
ncbi:MAG: HAMP domain-containing sensor histidine kinase [Pseudomonadota bacterium]